MSEKIWPVLKSSLSQEIVTEYEKLMHMIASIPISSRHLKKIEGTGGLVSICDLTAYQIGWGNCLMRWYESGVKGENSEMPGEGFSKWDYVAIAKHFYAKYSYDQAELQEQAFYQVVSHLIHIVEIENQTGHLEQVGVWAWCTLSSGKPWPLAKWVRVNTSAPYKRAQSAIRKAFYKKLNSGMIKVSD